jgi:hypothetical protein
VSRVLEYLDAERVRGNDDGIAASEIRQAVGGSHGGRSVAGELGRLRRAGDVEEVRRTDGRSRPLLYRARRGGEPAGRGSRVEATVVFDLASCPELGERDLGIALEQVLEASTLVVGPARVVARIDHAEVVSLGSVTP